MPSNDCSSNITQGVARSPNRAMFYALGYRREDFENPMIGIANGHSTITPCNAGLQPLADAASAAIRKAGGNPQMFGTPIISDGMAMGTEGMRYSLVSREVIADCVELSVQGQWMDGVLVIGGCDKNMPGGMMGILRTNVPAIYVYAGQSCPVAGRERICRSCPLSRLSAPTWPDRCRRRISRASSEMPVRLRDPAGACTRPIR